jgi:sortase A
MNKVKLSWGKLPLTVLSLGFMVLGIGCISWAMFSMWAQSDYSAHAIRSFPLGYTEGGVNVESDPSLVLPAPNKTLYPVYPAEGDNIGSLTIPALKRKLPILQGTGEKELKKGVGHFIQSVLPGEEDNCVFSGHRETVFRQIGNLKIGDQLIVQTSAGIFTYEVNGTRIVHADDKTVIVPTDQAVLTMTTCYPFYTPGYSPDRYIVSAALVKSK